MKSIVTASIALLLSTSLAGAADLIIDQPAYAVPDETVLSGIYAQVLVGGVLPGVQEWTDDFSGEWGMQAGPAAAAAIGVTIFDGLSVEADVFATNQDFDADDSDGSASSFSLMANLKYTFALNDAFDVYLAGGLGHVWETHLEDNKFTGWGYQVIVGAGYKITDNVSLVGEYRYRDTFGDMENTEDPDWTHKIPKHAILVGAKFSF